MRVYIQSKTGSYNTVKKYEGVWTLENILASLRENGGYYVPKDAEYSVDKYVPFEEIEYIRESKDE